MLATKIQIRQAERGDREALNALVTQTLRESLGDVLPEEELESCIADYHSWNDRQPCYIAEVEGVLVGYAVANRPLADVSPPPSGLVDRLYVRRRNLSASDQRLVASAILVSICEPPGGYDSTSAAAIADATTALALYDRWGFVDPAIFRICLSLPSGEGRLLTEEIPPDDALFA